MLTNALLVAIIVNVLASTIRMSTPLLTAAVGELVTEKSGVMNLGVEGTMLMGAWMGFLVAFKTNSLVLAILGAMATGAGMGLIMVFMAWTLKVDQTVTGLALNLFAAGASYFWYQVQFASFGRSASDLPTIQILDNLKIPVLGSLPVVGEVFFDQKVLTYIAFLLVPAVWYFLYRTKYGLRIRAAGENPRAVDMKGLSVGQLQYAAVIFGGMLAGLAGAFLTVGSSNRFVQNISAGRGWLAIVIVIAGNWTPGRILLATLVFAFLDALQLQLQGIGIQVPYEILLALPYLLAIVALAVSRTRALAPAWLGSPYERE